MDGLGGIDRVLEDLGGGKHTAEDEQRGQGQKVGIAVQEPKAVCNYLLNLITMHCMIPVLV